MKDLIRYLVILAIIARCSVGQCRPTLLSSRALSMIHRWSMAEAAPQRHRVLRPSPSTVFSGQSRLI